MGYTQDEKDKMIEVFHSALKLLGPNGENWIKGQYRDALGHVCLSQAIGYNQGQQSAYDFLRKQLRSTQKFYGYINEWNDQPERTFAEVKAELEAAIASLKA